MSKLVLDQQIPNEYKRADIAEVIRAICQQVNSHSEGRLAGRYQAQVSSPASVAAAVGDIVWNSTPSSGGPLGWVCVTSGNPATFYPFGGMPVLGAEVATTSGTSVDITGIPPWVTQIQFMLDGVSTNGTSALRFQIGDSGGIETASYTNTFTVLQNAAAVFVGTSTAGFDPTTGTSAGDTISGTLTLTLEDATNNTWEAVGNFQRGAGTVQFLSLSGVKATSAPLDRVRLTTAGGTDAFDAGAMSIRMS
jgi:hypothetical protein